MNPWHTVTRGTAEQCNAIIEITAGTRNKYELDKETGLLVLDRVIGTSMMYPADYGFIPQTYWEDGDPLDVLVLSRYPIQPLTIVPIRPVGVMRMIDDGEGDDKVIAVVATDPFFADVQDLADVETHKLKEIKHFFETYKALQHKTVVVEQFFGKEQAMQVIERGFELYDEKFAAVRKTEYVESAVA
jgi:inorganic pyrophosphatase